ncbi:MAG TPA: LysR substrate-binding domain-containing protein [Candidatus Sulfotelmatobacter sp.]|nr:LysR substrate-binding domain-containing protein [Candidatus Sulfotelmatobacter sp.]
MRYFVAVGEEQHYGRAGQRLRVAQPALSRQIQDLEDELGFKLFERLPRGVKLSSAGKLFLEDARRILQQVNEATARAARVAQGRSGTLRIGFMENASWHGVVPDSLRKFRERHPDAELKLNPASSADQIEDIRSGRVDAGFMYNILKDEGELDQLSVAIEHLKLAIPKGHRLSKIKRLRLRDLVGVPFIWFPRREGPAFYDSLMQECYRGGLKSPHIVQEAGNEATVLSLVSHGIGIGWINETALWRCPKNVVILPVTDLEIPLPMVLVWRKDNNSPLLEQFISEVKHVPAVQVLCKE